MLKPTRATAMRRSAILRPDVFSAAEFAMFMSLPASMGSEPTTRTTISLRDVLVGERLLQLEHDVGHRRQLHLPLRQLRGERLHEAEHHGVRQRARFDGRWWLPR